MSVCRPRLGFVFKPTGREAAGKPRWTRRPAAVHPTPHGVGLGQTTAHGSENPH